MSATLTSGAAIPPLPGPQVSDERPIEDLARYLRSRFTEAAAQFRSATQRGDWDQARHLRVTAERLLLSVRPGTHPFSTVRLWVAWARRLNEHFDTSQLPPTHN